MDIPQKTFKLGLILFAINILLFFGLLFLFSTQGSITEAQYFNYSVLISCFLLPALYASVAFYSVYSEAKLQPLHYKKIWRLAFIPMFVGGFLSMSSIFVFFNSSGSWAQDSLQRGWLDLMTANPNPEFEEKNQELINAMSDLSVNLFSLKNFFIFFSIVLFFYFLISTIFAIFIKNRRI